MANNPQTPVGRRRAANGAPCHACGTKYLNLYHVGGARVCYNCFKKLYPQEWKLYRRYRVFAIDLVPFQVWVAAGCPTDPKAIDRLREERNAG